MNDQENIIHGPGYIAKKIQNGYEIEFDPGAHIPQEVKVTLTEKEFFDLQSDSSKFQEIVVPAMEKQEVKVK